MEFVDFLVGMPLAMKSLMAGMVAFLVSCKLAQNWLDKNRKKANPFR
ncbi:MAG: hypothetical protein ACLFOY_06280 [Desulfatibacillaceae bacterium]